MLEKIPLNLLETFPKIKKNKIHMYCPYCKVKTHNITRVNGVDPKSAVLLVESCIVCYNIYGGKIIRYYDKNGICIVENY